MRSNGSPVILSVAGTIVALVLTVASTQLYGQGASAPGPAGDSASGAAAASGKTPAAGAAAETSPGKTPAAGAAAAPEKAEYVGTETCLQCHGNGYAKGWLSEPHGRFLMDPKRNVPGKGCEECHGPGSLHAGDPPGHIINPDKLSARLSNDNCLSCHKSEIQRHNWSTSAHAMAKVRCSDCHKVHLQADNVLMLPKPAPQLCFQCHKNIQNQLHQNSHHPVLEGKVSCGDCHNVHSGEFDGMLVADEKTTCTRCHADVRGPFIFEHDVTVNGYAQPCTSCHLPHGSPNTRLFKFAGKGLCLQCHTSQATNHFPGNCITCHSRDHGSNQDENLLR